MRKPFDYAAMRKDVYKQSAVKLPKLQKPTAPGEQGQTFGALPEYYYVIAKQDGRMAVLGPYSTETEGYEIASKLNVPNVVMPLSTRDRAKATAMVKHQLLSQHGDLAQALQRMRHSV